MYERFFEAFKEASMIFFYETTYYKSFINVFLKAFVKAF